MSSSSSTEVLRLSPVSTGRNTLALLLTTPEHVFDTHETQSFRLIGAKYAQPAAETPTPRGPLYASTVPEIYVVYPSLHMTFAVYTYNVGSKKIHKPSYFLLLEGQH
ncbi:hypothetical protein N7530_003305 [Penicillium desertorum]|uniref:Uncharacterized protein n=1 Tax=Penicillium desertorum TaxID=1303715 RepID=A0A9W9WWY6_9EURO|nr:hypothetical protein N7530_003305 [Penicillium desertorum]